MFGHQMALFLALAGLALGPVLAGALVRRARLYAALDGFVLAIVGALCLGHMLPHAYEVLGASALLLAAAGFVVPLITERRLHSHKKGESRWVLALAVLGLALHATLDGAALGAGGHHEAGAVDHASHELGVTLAILVHRLPVGLLVWWTVRPSLGKGTAISTLGALAAATVVGYVLSAQIAEFESGHAAGLVNALLAGGLLHVILGHGHPEHAEVQTPMASAVGALAGLGLFVALPLEHSTLIKEGWATTLDLFWESSPAIVLGFLGAGLLSLVPTETLSRLMTGKTVFTSALRGIVFGLPLPICSCGVVPIYRGLMQKGIPPAAAIAFLIATPELGIDAIVISVPLLGIELTIARLLGAVFVALAGGIVAGLILRGKEPLPLPNGCASTLGEVEPDQGPAERALRYGFVDSVDDLGPWILAGIFLAGALEPAIQDDWFEALPPLTDVPLLAAIAAPLYVCASAATPVGAVFLAKGVGAGAVVAFLLTGPATNVTTYGAIRTAHGRKATTIILAAILGSAVAAGYAINAASLPATSPALSGGHHAAEWWGYAAGALFGLMLFASLLRQGPRGFLGRLGLAHSHDDDHDHDHDDDQGDDHGDDHDDHDHGRPEPEPPASGCCGSKTPCG